MAEVLIEANQQLPNKQPILESAVYDRAEAIAITGFSLSTFIRAEQKGKLQARRQGRRVYFLGSDLLRWLQPDRSAQ